MERLEQIKSLLYQQDFHEALQLCDVELEKVSHLKKINQTLFYSLLSQKIAILIDLQRYDEALQVSHFAISRLKSRQKVSHKLYFPIVYQTISILMKLQKYDEALELCNEERCQTSLPILTLKVSILKELKQTKEALRICNKKICQDYSPIISLKSSIESENQEQKDVSVSQQQTFTPLIKDVFAVYISEIQKYLYCEMQKKENKDAILAWDRFEDIILKRIDDLKAVHFIIQFLNKVEKANAHDIVLSFDERKLNVIKKKYHL